MSRDDLEHEPNEDESQANSRTYHMLSSETVVGRRLCSEWSSRSNRVKVWLRRAPNKNKERAHHANSEPDRVPKLLVRHAYVYTEAVGHEYPLRRRFIRRALDERGPLFGSVVAPRRGVWLDGGWLSIGSALRRSVGRPVFGLTFRASSFRRASMNGRND